MASGIVEGPGTLLLVENRRRDGRTDWSPPGGVIDVAEGETVRDGLTREVHEETGIIVTDWEGPMWSVEAAADEAGWLLRVEVYRAAAYEGELLVDDPDGIVINAGFFPVGDCRAQLASTWLPTHEPLVAWLVERWTDERSFKYRIEGATREAFNVIRL